MESLWASFALVQVIKYILAAVKVHQVSSCWSLITHRVEVLALCCCLIGVLGGSASSLLSSWLTPLSRIHLWSCSRNGHWSWILVLLCWGMLPGGWCSIVYNVDLVAHYDWSVWVLVAVQIWSIVWLHRVSLSNEIVPIIALTPAVVVWSDCRRSLVVLIPSTEGALREWIQLTLWSMFNRIVVCARAMLSLCLELTEYTFVNTFHEGTRAISYHFSYRISHVSMLGIHLLDHFRWYICAICRVHWWSETLGDWTTVNQSCHRIVPVETASTLPHHEIVIELGRNWRIEAFLLATNLLDRFVLFRVVQQIGIICLLLFIALICKWAWATLTHLYCCMSFWLLQISRSLFSNR